MDMFNETWGNYQDGAVLPYIDSEMAKSQQKNFFLIHLIGTHAIYRQRYPQKFRKFSAADEFLGGGFDNQHQRTVRADYDNAVLYNDFIVNEIIKRFEDKNAIVIYISDHGEEVYDSMDYVGHHTGADKNGIEIPFLIWVSEKFREEYPDLCERIANSVHRPYMTDDLIHTILDITGIETPGYEPERSVINEKFNAERPRIYKNYLYDKEKGLIEIQ